MEERPATSENLGSGAAKLAGKMLLLVALGVLVDHHSRSSLLDGLIACAYAGTLVSIGLFPTLYGQYGRTRDNAAKHATIDVRYPSVAVDRIGPAARRPGASSGASRRFGPSVRATAEVGPLGPNG
jgi:hypothetical protein